jgi:type VI secretion system protein ImpB
MAVRSEFMVPDRQHDGEEMKVGLKIESMADFHPERVARQIPQLARMIGARNLLQDLRNRVISTSEFRKGLEKIVRDPAALDELIGELDRVVPANPPALPVES